MRTGFFSRELSYLPPKAPVVDITWLPQGLHDTPDLLRKMLMYTLTICTIKGEKRLLKHWPDFIVIGYGLCSNGIVGLVRADTPLRHSES